MKKRHILLSLLTIFLSINSTFSENKAVPLDTILERYYNQAAEAMSNGIYDSAQHYFNQAFAQKGVIANYILYY